MKMLQGALGQVLTPWDRLRREVPFWASLVAGCVLTVVLYALMTWIGPRFGLKL